MYLGDCVILVYKQLHYFTAAVHSIVFTSPFADEETKIPKGLSKTGPKSHIGEIVKPWFEPMPVHHPVSCPSGKGESKETSFKRAWSPEGWTRHNQISPLGRSIQNTHSSVAGGQQLPLNIWRITYYKIVMSLFFFTWETEERVTAAFLLHQEAA